MATVHIVLSESTSSSPPNSVPVDVDTITTNASAVLADLVGEPGQTWDVTATGGDVSVAFGPNPSATGLTRWLLLSGSNRQFAVTAAGEKVSVADWSASPAADLTLTLQQTDDQWAPELINLLSDNPGNEVTVSVEGDVTLRIWFDEEDVSNGQSRTFTLEELADGYARAISSAAPLGEENYWVLQYENAAAESVTKIVRFLIQEDPRLSYTLGSRTPAGYGGFPLHKLPGSLANKTISSQSTANALAIWTDPGDATRAWLTWGGTTYGATTSPGKTVASPSQGAGAYLVTINDAVLGRSWDISFDVDNKTLNARPAPGRDTATTHQIAQLISGAITGAPVRAGDIVLAEKGAGYPSLGSTRVWLPSAVSGEGGQTVPTSPFDNNDGKGWSPDGNVSRRIHAGWRTIKSREPLAVYPSHELNFAGSASVGYFGYVRFSGFAGSIKGYNGASSTYGWLMVDHCKTGAITLGNRDAQSALFLIKNNSNGQFSVVGVDCGMAWNCLRGIPTGDAYNIGFYSSDSSRKAFFAWNHGADKGVAPGDHADWCQYVFTSGVHLLMWAKPAGSTIYYGRHHGNSFDRGVGSTTGGLSVGTQMNLAGDVRTDCFHSHQFGGNIGQDLTPHGLWVKNLAADTKIRNNTFLYAYGVTSPFAGAGSPIFRVDEGVGQVGWEYANNVSTGVTQIVAGHTAPTGSNNRENIDAATAETLFSPAIDTFQTSQRLSQFIERVTPSEVNGGLLKDNAGGARPRIQGAVGAPALIDHRRRSISASFWS